MIKGSTIQPPDPSCQVVSLPICPDGSIDPAFISNVVLPAYRGDKEAQERLEYYRKLGVEVY